MSYRIEFKDLPPKYQKQALEQMQKSALSKAEVTSAKKKSTDGADSRLTKYRSVDVVTDRGLRFRSKKEEKRYYELLELLEAGVISDLKLEPQFTLIEGYKKPNGERVKRMRYTADFSYIRNGKLVVEDVKSRPTKTTSYQIRKNMMQDKYGITITEI